MSEYPSGQRGRFEFQGQEILAQRLMRGWRVSNGSRVIEDRFVGPALGQLLGLPEQQVLPLIVEVLQAQALDH